MQKNGRHIKRIANDNKGFYIILTACAIAIAISGYVLFFAPIANDESMDSVDYVPDLPQTTWQPDSQSTEQTVTDSEQLPENEMVDSTQTDDFEQTSDIFEQDIVNEVPANSQDETAKQTVSQTPVWVKPVNGEVLQAFSGSTLVYQQTFGDWRVHTGTDYSANAGENVYAVANGEITDVTKDDLWGSCVTIKLDDGKQAIYRGLDDNVKVSAGSKVSAGDVIGKVAKLVPAEASEASHIHFEILDANSSPIDPESMK